LAIVKSDILRKLSNNYPNFLKKDLSKLLEIIINQIEISLKKGERVELRDVFTLETRKRKPRQGINPKTLEKIYIDEKKAIHFKMSKNWLKKINEK